MINLIILTKLKISLIPVNQLIRSYKKIGRSNITVYFNFFKHFKK